MKKELSTKINELPSYVVFTVSGGTHFITKAEDDILRSASLDDLMELGNGVKVKVSTIAEIQPIGVYYAAHPDEKVQYDLYQSIDETFGVATDGGFQAFFHRQSESAKPQMIRGVENFIRENPNSPHATQLLEMMRMSVSLVS